MPYTRFDDSSAAACGRRMAEEAFSEERMVEQTPARYRSLSADR